MSKKVKTDHEFNIERYAELLSIAQGGRSQTEFAKDCDLSVAYICKSLNKKIVEPPIPSTIKKIAACAAGNVTYSELLDAAGYDSINWPATVSSTVTIKDSQNFEKNSLATISSSLFKTSFQWTPITDSTNSNYGFGIKLTNEQISNWFFIFAHDLEFNFEQLIPNHLATYYWKILTTRHNSDTKISFVTDSEKTYSNIKKHNPFMLSMLVSVILIDTENLAILKEENLETSAQTDTDIKERYTIKEQE